MNIAIIPAKGHSSRVPRKNARPFAGKPMLVHSIEAAFEAGVFDEIIVSTDDDQIDGIASAAGAGVTRRGHELAGDNVGPLDIARAYLQASVIGEWDFVCVIYATAPLMQVGDLLRGWRAVRRNGALYASSVGVAPFLHDAAQFFWCRATALRDRFPEWGDRTVLIPIAPDRDCDINTEADWQRCERMFAELQRYGSAA